MKKRWLRWVLIPALIAIIYLAAEPITLIGKPDVRAEAAVLMDLRTGKLLMDVNGNEALPSASMAKLMTELLVLEDVASGKLNWSDEVTISRYASTVGGVNLSLRHGELMTVSELFQSMVIYSANDAAVALAEHLSGSEAVFVQRMNEKAAKIGLSSATHFANASGAGEQELGLNHPANIHGDTRMTAGDTAKLASYLISTHPEILSTSSLTQMELKGKGLYLSNTNWMLSSLDGPYSYSGADGLKTGYTAEAGYCFTGTAEKNGTRLIAVVMGASSREERFKETRKLFDYGFDFEPSLKDRLLSWTYLAPGLSAL
ncbi:D-alanyl-D-alanine carboxypeptidase [Paenibacillus sp. P96]|uniref:D-alanyl-D-alanine carboxypeptidase n=1 Tax=Paenibacillus zeirhizosphaerae TaxID=2987519 RepID=A0ABT9FNY3_9BACL|nr:D-alanyl-D-alanine carboxypeptidase family protein [Paenibacillus sp. P96]MDP4096438.1 D-alanyl-D-alanine carboxypeptidase [Paenibacillus sp. P96]